MFCYGRIAGQISKISRHLNSGNPNNFYEEFNRYGLKTVATRYKSTKNNQTSGCTDLNNNTSKSSKSVPPLPPVPPPSIQNFSKNAVSNKNQPSCSDHDQCPASCPVYEECMKASGGKVPSNYMYWKQILAFLVLTGISLYVFRDSIYEFLDKDKDSSKSLPPKKKKKKGIPPSPLDSNDIPSEVPYLLIGGGTAAFAAFRAIKAGDPRAQVLVVSKENEYPYMRPPLSKELWYNKQDQLSEKLVFRQWNGTKRSLFYEPPEFYLDVKDLMKSEKGGVAIAKGWSVKKIDVSNKTAYLENGHKIKYNKCLIATGASPKNLEIFEKANDQVKEKIIAFRTKEDYLELVNNLANRNVKNIVIIGGGFLGSELACSIARNLNYKDQVVHQVFKEKSILAQVLPEYLSEWTTLQAQLEGVKCIPNAEVKDYKMENGKLSLILTNGQILPADQVIVAVGVKENSELAKESNLELDQEQGGFLVNAELEARRDLWVAGDVACFYDVKLGRRKIEHHDHAVISGRLAGENMTGAGKPYLHQSMFWSDLGPDVGFEAIGIVDSTLETVGVFAKSNEEDTPEAATLLKENVRTNTNQVSSEIEAKTDISQEQLLMTLHKDEKSDVSPKEALKQKNEESSMFEPSKEYGKGVIFYLRDKTVVGIVLWNIFNRMSTARQILARGTKVDELNEVAKLFTIHED